MEVNKLVEVLRATLDPNQREEAEKQLEIVSDKSEENIPNISWLLSMCHVQHFFFLLTSIDASKIAHLFFLINGQASSYVKYNITSSRRVYLKLFFWQYIVSAPGDVTRWLIFAWTTSLAYFLGLHVEAI